LQQQQKQQVCVGVGFCVGVGLEVGMGVGVGKWVYACYFRQQQVCEGIGVGVEKWVYECYLSERECVRVSVCMYA